MKAYKAWDDALDENYSTIVFAENVREAKKIAFCCDALDDADWISVRVKRQPEADRLYKGKPEIDWWDAETRLALVRDLGWACLDPYELECEKCAAKPYCRHWEEDDYE